MVHVDAEHALRAAVAVDDAVRRGRNPGPLADVPFVVKDNIDVHGQTTACGSRPHRGVVALTDSPVVRRLREAGAILLGRAHMDELAMGASTQTSAFGPTCNPFDQRRGPGGSSGGCAAEVASGLVPLAVGTDTGGSIREPAAQCGVIGMAPSPGLMPLDGVVTLDGVVRFAPGLDRVGPLVRDARDARALLEVLGARILTREAPRRVAVVEELVGGRNRMDVLTPFGAWLARLEKYGVELTMVSVPDAPRALAAFMTLTSVAADWPEPYVRTDQNRRGGAAALRVRSRAARHRWRRRGRGESGCAPAECQRARC